MFVNKHRPKYNGRNAGGEYRQIAIKKKDIKQQIYYENCSKIPHDYSTIEQTRFLNV
jgi:hypothetical protein